MGPARRQIAIRERAAFRSRAIEWAGGRMLVAMTRRPLRRLTRDAEAPLLLESFFVAAVASFLGIRWFLGITGYPRIGSTASTSPTCCGAAS